MEGRKAKKKKEKRKKKIKPKGSTVSGLGE